MKIDILHTNDIHSQISNLAKAGYYINQVRTTNPNTLLLDAGDMITGDFQFKFNQGQAEREISNYLKYDCVTLGNHDFDLTFADLKHHMSNLNSPYVLSNVFDTGNLIGEYKPYRIIEVAGVKIGIISFLLPYIEVILQDYPQFEFSHDYQLAVDQVREAGADMVICLNHHGVDRDRKIAAEVEGIDLIIGAHSHTVIEQPIEVNNTLIMQTGCFGVNLGHLQLTIESGLILDYSYNLVDITTDLPADQELQVIIDRYTTYADSFAQEVYGSCCHDLEGRREVMIKQSTDLGSLICDSYLDYARELGHNPDFAIINARGLRQSIPSGDITYKTLYNVIPFEKQMFIFEVTGSDLIAGLDNLIELQTANLRIIKGFNKPKQYFNQTIDQPLELDKMYQVVTMNYVYEHHLFSQLRNGNLIASNVGSDTDIVARYIKKLGHGFSYESNNMVETDE